MSWRGFASGLGQGLNAFGQSLQRGQLMQQEQDQFDARMREASNRSGMDDRNTQAQLMQRQAEMAQQLAIQKALMQENANERGVADLYRQGALMQDQKQHETSLAQAKDLAAMQFMAGDAQRMSQERMAREQNANTTRNTQIVAGALPAELRGLNTPQGKLNLAIDTFMKMSAQRSRAAAQAAGVLQIPGQQQRVIEADNARLVREQQAIMKALELGDPAPLIEYQLQSEIPQPTRTVDPAAAGLPPILQQLLQKR